MKLLIGPILSFLMLLISTSVDGQNKQKLPQHPNILWITCEDISPYLGCYDDPEAVTPVLDKLASQGIRYTHAYANTAVCAPARSTLITGVYASTLGTHNMRSQFRIPENIKPYPLYLREAGYYCTNHVKTDYNTSSFNRGIWDDCSKTASFKNRKPGQPFFAIYNLTVSHEHMIFDYDQAKLEHDPAKVNLPPYQPDLPEVRNDWARFYDNITEMDRQAGVILKELDDAGLTDSTIVFFYSDHGGIIARSKRFIYNTGTQVPFIIRFPAMYKSIAPGKSGETNDRLISFVDLAPTLLSLAGIPKPGNMQGRAFLGPHLDPPPDYVYFFRGRMDERYDMMLGITDHRYRYILNFMPDRPLGQHIQYLWRAKSIQAWEKAWHQGDCNPVQSLFWQKKPMEELYDTGKDPWEVNNLIGTIGSEVIRKKMEDALRNLVVRQRDAAFIPEPMLVKINDTTTIYAYTHSSAYPIHKIVELAFATPTEVQQKIKSFLEGLYSPNAIIRYWSVLGISRLEKQDGEIQEQLLSLLNDPSESVSLAAADAFMKHGPTDKAVETLHKMLRSIEPRVVLTALNIIQLSGNEIIQQFIPDMEYLKKNSKDGYIERAVNYALADVRP